MRDLDDLDMRLLGELARDSSASVPALSRRLGSNPSVLYGRIKRMVKKGLIRRFTIDIDESQLGVGVKASVGICRDPKLKESIRRGLMGTPEVSYVSEVTGRFDMMAGVMAGSLEELHSVVIEKIGKMDGVQSTETFVELQKADKGPPFLAGAG